MASLLQSVYNAPWGGTGSQSNKAWEQRIKHLLQFHNKSDFP